MRASDADREHVTDRLRQASAEGRIHAHELEERLATALRAKTYGELDATVDDLPRTQVRTRPKALTLARAHPFAAAALVTVVTLAVVVVAVVVIAWLAMLWGVWLLIGLFFFGRHRSGPRRQMPARR
jgi:Flp pilus assembly protein TadB